jgi:high-affinity K+ transport system ATPase subunit B
LVQAGEFRTETTVHAENLFVNDSRSRKAIEAVRESLPELDTETPLALVVESIDSVDGGTLVVSSENKEVLGVLDLVSQQKANGFETLFSAINVVPEENII